MTVRREEELSIEKDSEISGFRGVGVIYSFPYFKLFISFVLSSFDFEFVPPFYTMFATRFVSVARFGPSNFRPTYSRSPLREFSSQVPSHVRRNNALVAVAIVGFVTGVYYYSIYKMSKTVSDEILPHKFALF